ncbi:hydrogenase nickel incorporation protein HypB [Bradyrhizobium sp. Tv2a-2]|uniref:hydrogenase nickel incorporation protein HypB n=1 Tax=Bradyrhizobium sp. Tv2a-2 TaxID=113395 RepID=UPI00041B7C18|nr:hydrogenase nickel incorporation protein HypB [Bradyrhizobium sp. Tv2a-2]
MCTVCGCSEEAPSIERGDVQGNYARGHHHDHHDHRHGEHEGHRDHHHDHRDHRHKDSHDHRQHRPILTSSGIDRIIRIERDILGKNNRIAADNRARFLADELLVFNLVSSPGAGKTSVLVRAVSELKQSRPVGVIEGDQRTSTDAERIRATGTPAIQINTGRGCHLDAAMVGEAYSRLPPLKRGVLFIENIGNLVCPAAFDLGEAHKIVVFSTTEGEDKPLKYPDMFAASSLMLINKIDLAPALDFQFSNAIEYARRANPRIEVLPISARTGQGFAALSGWIQKRSPHQPPPKEARP